jgi:hypothetical protein
VASVDTVECDVVGTFSSKFDHYPLSRPVAHRERVNERLWKTVGTCADYQTVNPFPGKGFIIKSEQSRQFAVGVGIALEISQIAHSGIFPAEENLAFLNLTRDRETGSPLVASGGEGVVVAVGTSPGG